MLPAVLMLLDWSASAAAAPAVPLYAVGDGRRASALTGDGRISARVAVDSVRMVGTVPDQHRAQ